MFAFEFMRHAFAATGIVAVLSGLVGYFMVLRGESFAGHALSHVGFAGATGALLLGVPPLWGLLALTVAAGLAMGLGGRGTTQGRDVAIGLVLSCTLGFGLLFLHFLTTSATRATALLFGNVLGVDGAMLGWLALFGTACLAAMAVLSRPLLFASLQPEAAEARGVPLRAISTAFLAIVAIATAECVQVTGVLLVFALMVGPAATAQRLTASPGRGIVLSVVLAVAEGWGGLALSWWTDCPTSFWISALSTLAYLLACLPGVRGRVCLRP
ncbi:metal ABC transporter permease [Gluconacetobacter azotocaptans]|uniref:High-affinity zinc uptake system membrane protein ZnuB n=1 Tax=Gluconacetobacter azotocaptans TaxID=142834 RepID=A0A7W4PD43_9PROT|nr:metal ABC transporter permease [Gluconacetobacter azotocaptans]MBB2189315.1 metal ABC transporter permease [Gluconacetobacter azotocaptans]MBM9401290.1 metal ABC transporter permease [Gluconacetobacter azotocaptans]GBQ28672.1 Mn2+/Zn2+ transporter permease [Gluconacetobacter azotocaptans DSM 13594]